MNQYYSTKTPPRSISPLPSRTVQVTAIPATIVTTTTRMSPVKTELKVSKAYRSISPTPSLRDLHNYKTPNLIIENRDPASYRLQSLNQQKSELYQDLNKLNQENQALNVKISQLSQGFHWQSQSQGLHETLIAELGKIKEILSRCDLKTLVSTSQSQEIMYRASELEIIQTLVNNITAGLRTFEEKLLYLWQETERLGKEVVDWQNCASHQEAVYGIRLQDLHAKFQQSLNEKTINTTLTINDLEYKGRIRELEIRVQELEKGLLSMKGQKDVLEKEIYEKNWNFNETIDRLKRYKKEDEEKILLITQQLEKLLLIIEEKNRTIEGLRGGAQQRVSEIYNRPSEEVKVEKAKASGVDENLLWKKEKTELLQRVDYLEKELSKKNSNINPQERAELIQRIAFLEKELSNRTMTAHEDLLKRIRELEIQIDKEREEYELRIKIVEGELGRVRKEEEEKVRFLEKEIGFLKDQNNIGRKESHDKTQSYIQELTTRIQELEVGLERVHEESRTQLDAMNQNMSDLKAKEANTRKGMSLEIEKIRREWGEERKGAEGEIERLKGELNEARMKIDEFNTALADLREKGANSKKGLSLEIEKLKGEIEGWEKSNMEWEKRGKEWEKQSEHYQKEAGKLRESIEKLERLVEEWRAKYEKMEREYSEEIEEIKITFDEEKTNEKSDLELKWKAEIEVRDTKIMQQGNEIEELESKLKREEADNKEKDAELNKIKDEVGHLNEKVEALEELSRKKEGELMREVESLRRKMQDHEQKEARLTSEKKSLELMANQLKEDLKSKVTENETVHDLLEKRSQEIDELSKEVHDAKEESAHFKGQLKNATTEIAGKDEEISKIKKEMLELTELAEDYKNRMEAMNEELGNKNQELQLKIEKLDQVTKEYEKATKEVSQSGGGSPNKRSSISKKSVTRSSVVKTQFIEEGMVEGKEGSERGSIKKMGESGIHTESIKEEEKDLE